MDEDFRRAALDYHRLPRPGKLAIEPTKRMATQRDLALAYSPGVAAACLEIAADPDARARLHGARQPGRRDLQRHRGARPRQHRRARRQAGDGGQGGPVQEIRRHRRVRHRGRRETDPDRFCDVVAALEPTFGAINLEDIKAPECFAIEERAARAHGHPGLPRRPARHRDHRRRRRAQRAAAAGARTSPTCRLVTSGAGAAALACVDLLVAMGLRAENVTLTDIKGVVHAGREGVDARMGRYARETPARHAGGSAGGRGHLPRPVRAARAEGRMAGPVRGRRPLILALANPDPEITPEAGARGARPDAIVATGRSDYPNQVNNVLCFPFIFRGALDVGARTHQRGDGDCRGRGDRGAGARRGERGGRRRLWRAGADLRPRIHHPEAVRPAADPAHRACGRARGDGERRRHAGRSPISPPMAARLERFVFRSGQLMRPVFEAAKHVRDAHRLCRGRGRARAARGADGWWTRRSPSRSCSAGAP